MFDLCSIFLGQQDKVSAGGKAANVSPLFIEPKARESHLIHKAMTLEPHGLNRSDELL